MFKTKSGFTIVELLIVIVVIGILAAITIVAYNGIQQRARASATSAALNQTAKKLAIAMNDGTLTAYPASQAAFDALGIASTDVSYQYRTTSTGYCITATSGSVSYNISEKTAPAEGSCIGHTSGGNPLATNLVTNPSFETNAAGWGGYVGGTAVRVTGGDGAVAGSASLEATATTANQSGVLYTQSGLAGSTIYTFSVYVTPISGDFTNLGLRIADSAGTRASGNFSPVFSPGGQTLRKTISWTSSATPGATNVYVWRNGVAASLATFRIDAAMLEAGSTATGYSE